MSELTHFDAGGQAHMVDVGAKAHSRRRAVAEGRIRMLPATFALVKDGGHKRRCARHRPHRRHHGVQEGRGPDPALPPDRADRVAVDFELLEADSAVRIEVTAECSGQTGVEMEALTAAMSAC